MDLVRIPGSRIFEIAKLAFATPDVDFLCFGESDQPSPPVAHAAAIAALDAGETKYIDVRGLPPLRAVLADYLTALHAIPVAEERVQITASGMAAVTVALAAIVRAGERVVLHSPAWPNVGNAARLRQAEVVELGLTALPDGRFSLDFGRLDALLEGARAFILNSPNNPTGWTATHDELATILALCRKHGVWLISDEVYSRLVYDGSDAAPSVLDVAEPGDRVMVANSFSKTWVMTGWRLGWLVVPEGTRDAITEIVEATHSCVAPFVQQAGLAAIGDVVTVVWLPRPLRAWARAGERGAVGVERRALRRAGRGVLCVRGRGWAARQPGPGEAAGHAARCRRGAGHCVRRRRRGASADLFRAVGGADGTRDGAVA
jgi:aspartate/methionine/tyrosine aminotransferase